MLGQLLVWTVDGLLTPRASLRRLIRSGWGLDEAALLVGLGYCIQAIFAILIPGGRPPEVSGLPLGYHLGQILIQYTLFFLGSGGIYWGGRLFSGQGSLPDSYLAMGWYVLVTSLLSPILIAGVALAQLEAYSVFGAFLMFSVAAAGLWLLAAYIAEAHRFESVGKVFGAVFGSIFVLALLITLFAPGIGQGAPHV